MALVDYASSDEEEEEFTSPVPANGSSPSPPSAPLKRKFDADLPPLPSTFHNLYATSARLSARDDPSLHGGRKRITPHVEGNWPTHLYIEWYPSEADFEVLRNIISNIQQVCRANKLETHLSSDLGTPLPLHISLSRPVGFSTELKSVFLSSLQETLPNANIKPFDLAFSNLKWVPNHTKTRWFLVLGIKPPARDELNELLALCNRQVQEHGQSPLYIEASTPRRTKGSKQLEILDRSDAFHVSVGWCLAAPNDRDIEFLEELVESELFSKVKGMNLSVEELKAKIGNEVTGIPLSAKVLYGKSFLG